MTSKTITTAIKDKGLEDKKPIPTETVEEWYEVNADFITEEFEQLEFQQLHATLLNHLPQYPCSILDIGAGSGRDAAGLAELGHKVIAVEPSSALRTRARLLHPHSSITWVNDKLPELKAVRKRGDFYDVIFLSAVWMHLPYHDRQPSFERILGLLKKEGMLYITLRHGPYEVVEGFWDVPDEELMQLIKNYELREIEQSTENDLLNRPGVSWTRFILQLSDG
ncbi:MAG: class I SAM-dependent methyltransferase [Gammaproteobacteria bacterium]|nr:class I SAM-dependent methyltransferase [Gammaproteobacteria bacterium]